MTTMQQEVGKRLTQMRWALGLNGALSIAFAVAILVWPNISLYALVLVFGALALARGIVGLVVAFGGSMREGRGWLIVGSLAGIAFGVFTFFRTDMSALALLYVIGAYAIVLGVIAIAGTFSIPILSGGDRALLFVSGLVSILFGAVMFAKPGDGALVLLALIAAYALIVGVTELTVAIGGKRLVERTMERYFTPAEPKPQPSH
jgi:uncharacterized membrane protein HdeD (DUF308 family)